MKRTGIGERGKMVRGDILVQIYEIQTPGEAEKCAEAGIHHIGSVVLSEETWKDPVLKDTLRVIASTPSKSSLIPLFSSPDTVYRTLEYYRPDIVHFCELLHPGEHGREMREQLQELQRNVKRRFPEIAIMRSIPIPLAGSGIDFPVIELAREFQDVSDFFLTDTLIAGVQGAVAGDQPVKGFVGITGKICDWDMAADLVKAVPVPVILAGGLSPDNVAEGVRRVGPAGVDSCTATNALDSNGNPVRFRKDMEKVRMFYMNAAGLRQ
ncbi:MAG TPA: phosphoribosylanthranilate isomerase [Spirochaetota bacterium]|nr:phosphoribosylanthranilate isomerase [Spirochaetota bacterium]HQO01495.1 phosphoribosylanthranilate isomerase [Spirochaetota bacterium]HQP49578.1 phosphoribosylanthranilate isomerase [Spirochaetota bacterium]